MTYRPVLSIDSGWRRNPTTNELPQDPRRPVPQVYFRFEDERLSYTPLGVDAPISVELSTRPFRELFWLDRSPVAETTDYAGWDRFLIEARIRQEGLIGR